MRITYFFLLLLGLVFFNSCGTKYHLTHVFQTGNEYGYEMRTLKYDSAEDDGETEIIKPFWLNVSGGDNEKKYAFTYGEMFVLLTEEERIEYQREVEENPEIAEDLDNLLGMYKDITVNMELNEYFGLHMTNYDQVALKLRDVFRKIYSSKLFPGLQELDDEALGKIDNMMRQTYIDQGAMLSLYFPEISLIFGAEGVEISKSKPYKYEYETQHPISGTPIMVKGKLSIQSEDDTYLMLRDKSSISKKDIKRASQEIIKEYANDKSIDVKELNKALKGFSLEFDGISKYNKKTKLLEEIEKEKVVSASDRMQVENVQIFLKSILPSK